jgi:hypothetical protein
VDAILLLDWLDEKARGLRDAGVASVTWRNEMTSFEVTFSPAEPPTVVVKADRDAGGHLDPLNDPDTFGGMVPGYRRNRDEDET